MLEHRTTNNCRKVTTGCWLTSNTGFDVAGTIVKNNGRANFRSIKRRFLTGNLKIK